jgi:NADPH-dependent F420 reductase
MSRKIAVVGGTGAEGFGLASRWAKAGEQVVIGSRDAQRANAAAEKLKTAAGGNISIEGAENVAAVTGADIVMLTVPFEAHAATLKHIKPGLKAGAILIDATVPLATPIGGKPTQTIATWHGSAAQQAAAYVPEGVAVVGAFHNVSAELLAGSGAIDCDVIVCTNDKNARDVVNELVHRIPGLRAVDGGILDNSRIVEQITALLITINIRQKTHGAGLRITGLPTQS